MVFDQTNDHQHLTSIWSTWDYYIGHIFIRAESGRLDSGSGQTRLLLGSKHFVHLESVNIDQPVLGLKRGSINGFTRSVCQHCQCVKSGLDSKHMKNMKPVQREHIKYIPQIHVCALCTIMWYNECMCYYVYVCLEAFYFLQPSLLKYPNL